MKGQQAERCFMAGARPLIAEGTCGPRGALTSPRALTGRRSGFLVHETGGQGPALALLWARRFHSRALILARTETRGSETLLADRRSPHGHARMIGEEGRGGGLGVAFVPAFHAAGLHEPRSVR